MRECWEKLWSATTSNLHALFRFYKYILKKTSVYNASLCTATLKKHLWTVSCRCPPDVPLISPPFFLLWADTCLHISLKIAAHGVHTMYTSSQYLPSAWKPETSFWHFPVEISPPTLKVLWLNCFCTASAACIWVLLLHSTDSLYDLFIIFFKLMI